MKFNGEYNEDERRALEIATRAANEALARAHEEGGACEFFVSHIELGGSELGALDPFYAIGATHEAEAT